MDNLTYKIQSEEPFGGNAKVMSDGSIRVQTEVYPNIFYEDRFAPYYEEGYVVDH